MADMLVKLYGMEFKDYSARMNSHGVAIKRAFITDREQILQFVGENFPASKGWPHECAYALLQNPITCYIAVHEGQVVGFACYDATAKGFFGPTGVAESHRGKGIGAALLMRCLWSMRESGYAYAIIGWSAQSAIPFYQRLTGAVIIEDSPPEKSAYRNMIAIE